MCVYSSFNIWASERKSAVGHFKENGDKEIDMPCTVQLISRQERGNPIALAGKLV